MGVEWRRKLPIAGHDTNIVEDDAGDGLRDIKRGGGWVGSGDVNF